MVHRTAVAWSQFMCESLTYVRYIVDRSIVSLESRERRAVSLGVIGSRSVDTSGVWSVSYASRLLPAAVRSMRENGGGCNEGAAPLWIAVSSVAMPWRISQNDASTIAMCSAKRTCARTTVDRARANVLGAG